MDECFNKAREFFELPQNVKDNYKMDGQTMAGYFGHGAENLDDVVADTGVKSVKRDCKEGYDMAATDAIDLSRVATSKTAYRWLSNMIWPKEVVDFDDAMLTYQYQVLGLGLKLMEQLGRALDLPDPLTLLKACEGKSVCTHRVLHYPPLTDYHKEISVGAHIDYGFITILMTDMVGGLQVLNSSERRQWVHVPPIKHGFVVNFGDMLAKWTGNRVKATVHRVVNLT